MTILRDYTNEKHRKVENTEFVQYLLSGNITKEHYLKFLFEFHHIYDNIERLAKHAGVMDGLDGIERTDKIWQDIVELNPQYYHGGYLPVTLKYIQHLLDISGNDNRKHLMLAHVYVRHMGDLYGGKIIAKLVPGSGNMYQFDDRPGLIKAFNQKLTLDLKDEALVAFDYFNDIFTDLWKEIHK